MGAKFPRHPAAGNTAMTAPSPTMATTIGTAESERKKISRSKGEQGKAHGGKKFNVIPE